MSMATFPRLLIVDDDRLVLAVLASGLRDAGFEVFEADNGDDAILLSRQHKPALAILDMQMHGKSGLDVARYLAAHTEVAFMFLTAYSDPELVDEATRCGAMGYLLKPLDVRQILPSVRAALARAGEIRTARAASPRADENRHMPADAPAADVVQIAVGILMQRFGYSQRAAVEQLQQQSAAESKTIGEFCRAMVGSLEQSNQTNLLTTGK